MIGTVSRSHEEAAKDAEWPGPPLAKLKQTTLPRPPPPPPAPERKRRAKERKKSEKLNAS